MADQTKNEIHIGKMLRAHMDKNKYNKAALARQAGWKARNVAHYFKRPSVQVSTLIMLSHGMKYNFLRDLADELPAEFPSKTPPALAVRISELEKEVERLRIEIAVLERMKK